jgi:hypothetical protein
MAGGGGGGGGGGGSGAAGGLEVQWPGRCCRGGALAVCATSAATMLGNAAPLGRVGGALSVSEDRGRALRPRCRQQPHAAAGSAVDKGALGGALGGLLHVQRPGVADVAAPHSRHVLAPRGSPPEG